MTLDRSILQILICDPLLLAEFWCHRCIDLLTDEPVVCLIERAVACVDKVGTARMWAVASAQLGDTALETLVATTEGPTTREAYTDVVCALQERWLLAQIKEAGAVDVPDIDRLEKLSGHLRTVRDHRACADGRPSCGTVPSLGAPTVEYAMATSAMIKAYRERRP